MGVCALHLTHITRGCIICKKASLPCMRVVSCMSSKRDRASKAHFEAS